MNANMYTFNSTNKVSLNELYNQLYAAISSQNLVNIINKKEKLDNDLEGSYAIAFNGLTIPCITDINFANGPSEALIKTIKKEMRDLKKSRIYVSKFSYKVSKYYFKCLEELRKNYYKFARN